jgi:hypothetical protein
MPNRLARRVCFGLATRATADRRGTAREWLAKSKFGWESTVWTSPRPDAKGVSLLFAFLSAILQSSKLCGQAVSLWPLASSSINSPTLSVVQPFCRSARACGHPNAELRRAVISLNRNRKRVGSLSCNGKDNLSCESTLVEIPARRSRRLQFQAGLPEFFGNQMNDTILNLELPRDA